MLVLEIVVAAAIIFAVAAVAMGYGGSITHFAPDWPGRRLPEDRAVRADDVTRARFSLAFRGYRMSEVDDALDRLAVEIAQRDARIEALTGRAYEAPDPADEAQSIDTAEHLEAPAQPEQPEQPEQPAPIEP